MESNEIYLTATGALSLLLALAHSGLGERMIFRRDQVTGRFRGIIRATWHGVSLFGLALGVLLIALASDPEPAVFNRLFRNLMTATTGSLGLLVLIWTRGRHPGWIVLLVIAGLVALTG